MLIGRSSGGDLVLHDPRVSRHHARLFFREGRWILVDLRSTNGTYVNVVRVQRGERLPGDVLALGTERLQVD
jgi:pSer/pThr/pTyr-binding forkhead associated (FHA) protein